MALMETGPDYTKTGRTTTSALVSAKTGNVIKPGILDNIASFFTRWANRASFFPFIGGPIAWGLGQIGTVVEAAGWLFRGRIASAGTVLAAGTVGNFVNSMHKGLENIPIVGTAARWWLNIGSGALTGHSIGTNARALTEGAIGTVTGALGFKPEVLDYHVAGVGSIGGNDMSRPGTFASRISKEQGQDPQAQWDRNRSGAGAEHMAALEAARAQGPEQRGV